MFLEKWRRCNPAHHSLAVTGGVTGSHSATSPPVTHPGSSTSRGPDPLWCAQVAALVLGTRNSTSFAFVINLRQIVPLLLGGER